MFPRLLAAGILSAVAFGLWSITTNTASESLQHTEAPEFVFAQQVLDGDTIVLQGGEKVRYIGIDTPEFFGETQECFATEARLRNMQLIQGKRLRLERDVSETDTYDRLLRYVYIDDPISSLHSNTSINETLVREGFAVARAFPPDTKLQSILEEAEKDARENKRGIWSTACTK